MGAATLTSESRAMLARRGRWLEIATIVWATLEATLALVSAARQHSVSLAGFGGDSLIEVISAITLFWRMSHEMNHERRHRAEHISLKVAGICLLVLAASVLVEALRSLTHHRTSSADAIGIAVTLAALLCMPALARAKRKVARALHSNALLTDATQADFCTIQAGIVLVGLALNRLLGLTWTDSAAALILVPFLTRAGILALRGQHCCTH